MQREKRVKQEGGSNSTKFDFTSMCAWGSVSPETAGEKPTRVIVGDIREVRLPPNLGFQICQSNATQSRVGICFRVELETPGNPRELHKGGNFTPHLRTPCLQVHSCLHVTNAFLPLISLCPGLGALCVMIHLLLTALQGKCCDWHSAASEEAKAQKG